MFKFTLENDLQQFLIKNFDKFFDFNFVTDEQRIKSGRIDIIGEDLLTIYIIEIKRDFVTNDTIDQLKRYLDTYKSDKQLVGIATAPQVASDFDWTSLPENIWVKQIEGVQYVHNPESKFKTAVTLDIDVFEAISKAAEEDDRSISSMINKILRDFVKEKGK